MEMGSFKLDIDWGNITSNNGATLSKAQIDDSRIFGLIRGYVDFNGVPDTPLSQFRSPHNRNYLFEGPVVLLIEFEIEFEHLNPVLAEFLIRRTHRT